MTHVYLAVSGGYGNVQRALNAWDWQAQPLNLLIAFPYLKKYRKDAQRWAPGRVMLDSGAFSAWQSGHVIDLEALARESKNQRWTETVGLDVIGNWLGSRLNAIKFKALRSPAMPVFHIGDPWELLDFYCKHWPKIGLSCRFGEPPSESTRFYDGCFARAWPHRFHSFGWTQTEMLLRFPFHSADSTTWTTPVAFASGIKIQGARIGTVRGATNDILEATLPYNMKSFFELQQRLYAKWQRILNPLGDYP